MKLFEAAAVLRMPEDRLGRELRSDASLAIGERRHRSAEQSASGRWTFDSVLLRGEVPVNDHAAHRWLSGWERGEVEFCRPPRRWDAPLAPGLAAPRQRSSQSVPDRSL
ncbi:MAG: hypothetical protein AB7I38_16760 [Dehalococcoidia bacterium]|jgi:hypothetical protein